MTRLSCKIQPVHPDGTVCKHNIKPSGKPLQPGCPGRAGYEATCSCGEQLPRQGIRAVLEEQRLAHLRQHATQPVSTEKGQPHE